MQRVDERSVHDGDAFLRDSILPKSLMTRTARSMRTCGQACARAKLLFFPKKLPTGTGVRATWTAGAAAGVSTRAGAGAALMVSEGDAAEASGVVETTACAGAPAAGFGAASGVAGAVLTAGATELALGGLTGCGFGLGRSK